MQLILQPCGNSDARKHYVDSVEKNIIFSRYPTLSPIIQMLNLKFPHGKAAVWGVTPGKDDVNKRKWEKINVGDIAIFSKDGGIFAVATVGLKYHSLDFANNLWGKNKEGATWEYTYFLDEVKPLKLTYGEFSKFVGYDENFVIQGFNVLTAEKSQIFIDHFNLESLTHFPTVSIADLDSAISKYQELETLDKIVQSTIRTEQNYLRNSLFRGSVSVCALCGNQYPISFLVAAHIKKRSVCSHQERLDVKNVVMGLCKFGCDELFERGYISVSDTGSIIKSSKKLHTIASEAHVASLVGKKCTAFCAANNAYFGWHRENVF